MNLPAMVLVVQEQMQQRIAQGFHLHAPGPVDLHHQPQILRHQRLGPLQQPQIQLFLRRQPVIRGGAGVHPRLRGIGPDSALHRHQIKLTHQQHVRQRCPQRWEERHPRRLPLRGRQRGNRRVKAAVGQQGIAGHLAIGAANVHAKGDHGPPVG